MNGIKEKHGFLISTTFKHIKKGYVADLCKYMNLEIYFFKWIYYFLDFTPDLINVYTQRAKITFPLFPALLLDELTDQ